MSYPLPPFLGNQNNKALGEDETGIETVKYGKKLLLTVQLSCHSNNTKQREQGFYQQYAQKSNIRTEKQRAISLLPQLYKLLAKRLSAKLDVYQPSAGLVLVSVLMKTSLLRA